MVNLTLIFPSLLLFNKSIMYEITKTGVSIVNTAYNPYQVTAVVWYSELDVTELLEGLRGSFITVSINYDSDLNKNTSIINIHKHTQIVFIASAAYEFIDFVTKISKHVVVPPQMILIMMQPITTRRQLIEITKIAWKNDIADIVILTINKDQHITESTYFPYNGKRCGDYTPVTIRKNGRSVNYFPNKFTNFYGCPVRITVIHYLPYVVLEFKNDTLTSISGVDGSVLKCLIDKLNFTIDLVTYTDHGGIGNYYKNGSRTGSYGDLINRVADILLPSVILTIERYCHAQVSHSYQTVNIYWVGPKRRELYTWAKAILPLFTSTTPYLLLSFTVFVIIAVVFQKYYKLQETNYDDGIVFQALGLFFGQGVQFETHFWLYNSLFVLWIWLCQIVRIVYQGDLLNGLHKIILEPHMGSIEDAVKEVDGYGGAEAYREFYRNTSLWKNFKVIPTADVPAYVDDIGKGKRFLIAYDYLRLRLTRLSVQILERPLTRIPMVTYMRPGWPAAKQFDFAILNIVEAGLVHKIYQDYRHTWMLKGPRNKTQSEGSESDPLDMEVLGACFYGLFLMWIICFIILFVEILFKNLHRKKK